MGAVQKLATVVIIGLVALATVLTVYIAREPERRGSESAVQEEIAIVRGTDLYIQFCLQCHGPSGLGAAGGDGRVGGILNSDFYQSDDAAQLALAEDFARYRIQYGVPADPRSDDEILMPAFSNELNEAQIENLISLILSGNWDYVYNQAVIETGELVAQRECDATPVPGESAERPAYCDNIEEAPPVYPTAPPIAPPEGDAEGEDDEESGEGEEPAGEPVAELEASDPYEWSQYELSLAPGDTIAVTNVGSLQHNFTVDELGIAEDLPNGETVMITIPEDAEPGDYEFYCSVPGHREGGMVGTLTIEAP